MPDGWLKLNRVCFGGIGGRKKRKSGPRKILDAVESSLIKIFDFNEWKNRRRGRNILKGIIRNRKLERRNFFASVKRLVDP